MSEKILTSSVTATGGREGHVRSEDGKIDMDLAMPGTDRAKAFPSAVNPEEFFAAGYSACFDGSLQLMAKKERIKFDSEVTADVSLLKDEETDGFKLAVTLRVKGTGIEQEKLESLVKKAHDFCPYSKATRGNIEVKLESSAEQ
ncbi:organic hydroperoxide resistance protein [Bacillus sp. FJAT-27445]|uniref:organic hydroperoxide resistance protein n=1 Tax=Bacillus sp. FJAT-27445 TaxID=1679166 RepID=UPI000743DB26|nr:organic hydroperoxide resistance protein [Bacillus sp. FJAT-27445]